jgi:RNA polymerase sigma factor (sigma-70 family)
MATPDEPSEPPESFNDFLERMEPRLKGILAKYRIPPEDAEDVLQQALLTLLYQWERVRDPECWLLGTLKRHCLVYWRKRRRQIYSAVESTILESMAVASTQEKADLLCDLDHLMDRLPSRCRSLLQLRFRLGYEPPEIARQLGYRVSSIGKITTRCLAALSRELMGG